MVNRANYFDTDLERIFYARFPRASYRSWRAFVSLHPLTVDYLYRRYQEVFRDPTRFLWLLHFLKVYPDGENATLLWGVSRPTWATSIETQLQQCYDIWDEVRNEN